MANRDLLRISKAISIEGAAVLHIGLYDSAPISQSFEQFVAEVGLRPPGTSIDRIDPEGHYEPGNVRWLNTARNGTRVATKSFSELCVGTA